MNITSLYMRIDIFRQYGDKQISLFGPYKSIYKKVLSYNYNEIYKDKSNRQMSSSTLDALPKVYNTLTSSGIWGKT